MIVADTSALISLATADSLTIVLNEFTVHTTETVIGELNDTAAYDDAAGTAATQALKQQERFTIHTVDEANVPTTSRVDIGEGSCVVLANRIDARFLITDDLRALPELQQLCNAQVAISPIVLKALVNRGVLTTEEAKNRVEHLAETRDWLGAPIYRRALELFENSA